MGYHLTILRTASGQISPISLHEFTTAATSVDGLMLDESGETVRLICNGVLRATIVFDDGTIRTNIADDDVLRIMLELARKLDARVRGDEGETYRSPSESYLHPDDAAEFDIEQSARRIRMCRRKIWNGFRIIVLFGVVGLAVARCVRV